MPEEIIAGKGRQEICKLAGVPDEWPIWCQYQEHPSPS